ncbi:unnamed protein product [Protopolystoma xenopodis]|uniref:Uncharacterized protein n=1 Tax=Protopolystoma xenopodis TaxID=117903 RepID=A0A448WEC4_9PLAT|nr:unnamed protein product [Protopolystoma xenopodis]
MAAGFTSPANLGDDGDSSPHLYRFAAPWSTPHFSLPQDSTNYSYSATLPGFSSFDTSSKVSTSPGVHPNLVESSSELLNVFRSGALETSLNSGGWRSMPDSSIWFACSVTFHQVSSLGQRHFYVIFSEEDIVGRQTPIDREVC